jgi:hypothetical protein
LISGLFLLVPEEFPGQQLEWPHQEPTCPCRQQQDHDKNHDGRVQQERCGGSYEITEGKGDYYSGIHGDLQTLNNMAGIAGASLKYAHHASLLRLPAR